MADFSVNYQAGQRLRRAETLYRVEDEHYMFKYLPSSAVFYAPLTYLPLQTAKAVWYALSLFCSVLLFYLAHRYFSGNAHGRLWTGIIPALVLVRYFFREWELGQINALVSLIVFLAVFRLADTRPPAGIGAGILWGLSVCLKPYTVLFLLYLLVRKRWTAVVSGLSTLALGAALPALYYGLSGNWTVHKEWFQTLTRSTPGLLSSQDNVSLFALFMKWTGDRPLALVLGGAAVFILGLVYFSMLLKASARPQAILCEGAVLLLCIPLVSPLGWDYTLILALPALMLLLRHYHYFSRGWQALLAVNLLIVALAAYDILGPVLYARFMTWSVITLNFLVLFGFCVSLRFRRLC